MKNLRCKVHQLEPITNFCLKDQCLTQLCASCISHHTNMHVLIGTLPQYQNIQETIIRTYETIDAQKLTLELEKKNIVGFGKSWEKKKQTIYQKFNLAKKQMIDMINKVFVEIQKNIQERFHDEEIMFGLEHNGQVIKLIQECNEELEKLQSMQKKLQTIKCAQVVKLLYSETIPEIIELSARIDKNILQFEGHEVEFSYPISAFKDIKHQLIDLMTVKITYPSSPKLALREIKQPPQLQQALISSISYTPMLKTCSSFYSRPKSVTKPIIPGKVIYVNGGSQVRVQSKPKISVMPRNINLGQSLNRSQMMLENVTQQSCILTARSISSQMR